MAKIIQRVVRIDACAFIQECAYIKRGYMRLNKRPCAAIRDVRMFELLSPKWPFLTSKSTALYWLCSHYLYCSFLELLYLLIIWSATDCHYWFFIFYLQGGVERKIHHIWYTNWPDFGKLLGCLLCSFVTLPTMDFPKRGQPPHNGCYL